MNLDSYRDQVFLGDALESLRKLPEGIVQCCVTSPPYYGLRDYGVSGQVGLEETPDEYVAKLVEIFREVRRVLRDDGTLWLNLGDSFATTPTGNRGTKSGLHGADGDAYAVTLDRYTEAKTKRATIPPGLKPKDLIGIPWMVAFALRKDGWWLRSDIVWSKPSCMPESVRDRPTRSHEYVFLLSKSQDYFYNQEAIKEPSIGGHSSGVKERAENHQEGRSGFGTRVPWDDLGQGRNKRSVWTINPQPYKGAHFAVMPEELARLCIKAGSSKGSLILDPFAGSGTTLAVAAQLERSYLGIELNPQYGELIEERLRPAVEYRGQREIFEIAMNWEEEE